MSLSLSPRIQFADLSSQSGLVSFCKIIKWLFYVIVTWVSSIFSVNLQLKFCLLMKYALKNSLGISSHLKGTFVECGASEKGIRCFDIYRIFPFCTFCILYTLQIFWIWYILFMNVWHFAYFVFCTCCILHILHCALFVSVWYLPDISILHRAGAGATFGCTE